MRSAQKPNCRRTSPGWSRATIWRKVKAGILPAPIPIGPKSVAWDATEIAQWQQRCIDASRGVG
ncbi:MAG: AlpA family phage regulatory protein [Burkholderiaceae bacterium]|nr:AlpA family phage regulatory protein [Burkholderiaceae bacterium]